MITFLKYIIELGLTQMGNIFRRFHISSLIQEALFRLPPFAGIVIQKIKQFTIVFLNVICLRLHSISCSVNC